MKKIYIIILVLFTTVIVSCDKDDDNNGIDKAAFRVKRITGTNEQWGQFELLFQYADNNLERVWRRNTAQEESRRDTLGRFAIDYQNVSTVIYIYDYVLNIDADSLATLQTQYPTSYSDTLRRRRVSRTLFSRTIYRTENYMISRSYAPREDVGSGSNFDNRYKSVSQIKSLLEYDMQNRISIVRRFVDEYVQDDLNTDYDRTVDKYEFSYSGNDPSAAEYYVQDSHVDESWRNEGSWEYSYSGKKTASISGTGYKWERSGTTVTITEGGNVTTCTLDSNDNITAIKLPSGVLLTIEYESGQGNFSQLFYSPEEVLLGKALIK